MNNAVDLQNMILYFYKFISINSNVKISIIYILCVQAEVHAILKHESNTHLHSFIITNISCAP